MRTFLEQPVLPPRSGHATNRSFDVDRQQLSVDDDVAYLARCGAEQFLKLLLVELGHAGVPWPRDSFARRDKVQAAVLHAFERALHWPICGLSARPRSFPKQLAVPNRPRRSG